VPKHLHAEYEAKIETITHEVVQGSTHRSDHTPVTRAGVCCLVR
jgi:hypothetical protein